MKTYYYAVQAENMEEARKEIIKGVGSGNFIQEIEENEKIEVLKDNLNEILEYAESELKEIFKDKILENYNNEFDKFEIADYIGDIADRATPIYHWNIKCLWFYYEDDFTESFYNSGTDGDSKDRNGMVAIYFYIQDHLYNVLNYLEDEWRDFEKYRDNLEITKEDREKFKKEDDIIKKMMIEEYIKTNF